MSRDAMMMWTRRDTGNTSPKYNKQLEMWEDQKRGKMPCCPPNTPSSHRNRFTYSFGCALTSLASDLFTSAWEKSVRSNKANLSLSQENTTVESQNSLVHHKKIPKLKTQLVCSFKCKNSILNKSYTPIVPKMTIRNWSFIFAIGKSGRC